MDRYEIARNLKPSLKKAKAEILNKISQEVYKILLCGSSQSHRLVQSHGRKYPVASFYKEASSGEREAMGSLTSKELFGRGAKDVTLFDTLKAKKKKGRWA
jgi:hypothetical protein